MPKYKLEFNDKELDIIVSMLNLCARSIKIIATDPDNPLDGLKELERLPEEKLLAKQIIQKIGRECL